jgi:nucleoid-associated protein YgaU
MSRDSQRQVAKNDNPMYVEIFEERNVNKIDQYRTKTLKNPSNKEINNLDLTKYYWQSNDDYYTVSEKFYGDSKYWYVIAQFNRIPFEGNIKVGDTLMIPRPLGRVLQVLK